MLCPLELAPLKVDEATGTGLVGAEVGTGAGAGMVDGSEVGAGACPDPPPVIEVHVHAQTKRLS